MNMSFFEYYALLLFSFRSGLARRERRGKKRTRCRNSDDIEAYARVLIHRKENVKLIVANCKDRF